MKMAKRTLSIVLALMMALGVFSLAAVAADPADYTAVNAAISTNLPGAADRKYYTAEANALIDNVVNNLINWNLTTAEQATVDGYVTMVTDLGNFLKSYVTAAGQTLSFDYGSGYAAYVPAYPYGDAGVNFYPFRAEENCVFDLGFQASVTALPVGSTDTFTVTITLNTVDLMLAGGIPFLFDQTKLEVVGNNGNNASFPVTELGSNIANKYKYTATLNPSVSTFWPLVYRNDAAFKAKWGAVNIVVTQDTTSGLPRCVTTNGLDESILQFTFRLKAGATAGEAVIYIDPAFKRDALNRQNALYLSRAKNADAMVVYDTLASYGTTVDVTDARAVVNIVGETTITIDPANGQPTSQIAGFPGAVTPQVADPVWEGHTFTGWNPPIPAHFPMTSFTAVAQWDVNSYSAVFKVDGAEYATVPTQYGAAIQAPADPVKEGYTFSGWSQIPATMPAQDVEINGSFSINTYDAIFKSDGAVYQTVPTQYGAVIQVPADPVKEGYVFEGWLPVPGTMGAGDEVFVAQWRQNVDIINVTNNNVYKFGQYTEFTVLVKGSPCKIQFASANNLANTLTYWRDINPNILSITPTMFDYGDGPMPCETWVIRVFISMSDGEWLARAKYGDPLGPYGLWYHSIFIASAPLDAAVYDIQIDHNKFVFGATSVITIKTGPDATKVRLTNPAGATRTYGIAYSPYVDQGGFRYWTITTKFGSLGPNSWTVVAYDVKGNANPAAAPLTFTVFQTEVPIDPGRGVISVALADNRVLWNIPTNVTVTTEIDCTAVLVTRNGIVQRFTPANATYVDEAGTRVWTVPVIFGALGECTYTVSAMFGSVVAASTKDFTVTVLY